MLRKLARKAAILLIWLGLWAGAAALVVQPLLLPSPVHTAQSLWALARQGVFWLSAGASILRILTGFALGVCLGSGLAVLTSRFRFIKELFAPFLSAVKATPMASFIVLALLWLKSSGVPTFATLLIVLPVVWANVSAGIGGTDMELVEMARAFGLKGLPLARKIYWPSIRPSLQAAIATGMGMAWKAGIAAEVICTPRNAVGTWLYNAKVYFNTAEMFAVTAVVIALSILLEKLVVAVAYGREGRPGRA